MALHKPEPRRATLLLPPRFLGSVEYYAAMMAYTDAVIDTSMPFNKRQKATHRTRILDANGEAMVTVPIEKPESMSRACWSDIIVSGHDSWWVNAVTALRSAYGRTPFFEYYFDDFLPLLTASAAGRHLMEFTADFDRLLRRLLCIDTAVSYGPVNAISAPVADYRSRTLDFVKPKEYYQLRAAKYGFHPSLSVVDLLFNLGPEAPLLLAGMTENNRP